MCNIKIMTNSHSGIDLSIITNPQFVQVHCCNNVITAVNSSLGFMIRAETFRHLNGFDEKLDFNEDNDIWIRYKNLHPESEIGFLSLPMASR